MVADVMVADDAEGGGCGENDRDVGDARSAPPC
jgi:hypothetical protein